MLRISPSALAAIRRHGEEGYPFEVCGFLAGTASGEARRACRAWPVRNAWEDDPETRQDMLESLSRSGEASSPPQGEQPAPAPSAGEWQEHGEGRRFLIDPYDILAAMKRARAAGFDLVGFYHTHPDHSAIPSAFDRAAAWPGWSHLILSVRQGRARETRSWVVEEDGPFQEETITAASPGPRGTRFRMARRGEGG